MAADGLPHLLRVIGDHGRCVRDGRFQPDAPVSPWDGYCALSLRPALRQS